MADLSQLTDEQLGAYRDLLTQKQAPPVPTPPLPSGLKPEPKETDVFPGATGPMQGSPILPSSAIIPSAIGYGVSKLGEHVGLPDWANTTAGIVAGGLAGAGRSIGSKILSSDPETNAMGLRRLVQILPKGKAMTDLWDTYHPQPQAPSMPAPPVSFRPQVQGNVVPAPPISFRAESPTPQASIVAPPPVRFRDAPAQGTPTMAPPPVTFKPSVSSGSNPPLAPIKPGGPSVSWGAAPKVTPGAIPELMRQQRLSAPPAPDPSPIIAPQGVTEASPRLTGVPELDQPTFANGGIKSNVRRR